jgi:hypothetical protein
MTSTAAPERILINQVNALKSTGPKTTEGIEVARFNAVRHGLRALQTVIPGEDPEAWEAHRAGIVEDLKPVGAVELALAEQIAAKLWRLGRVVRHEADAIAIAQDADELASAHEIAFERTSFSDIPKRTDIPNVEEVRKAANSASEARQKAERLETVISQLEATPLMKDTDSFAGWDLYQLLCESLHLSEEEVGRVFDGEDEGSLEVRNVRGMLALRGDPLEATRGVIGIWRRQKADAEADAQKADIEHKRIQRRYEAALERLKLSRGLPNEVVLNKIQRYEAHLERGLHKALERLRMLQEVRGAIPSSHKPAVALAVIQSTSHVAGVGSFGSFAIEGAAEGSASN